jgi:hypothetical protein
MPLYFVVLIKHENMFANTGFTFPSDVVKPKDDTPGASLLVGLKNIRKPSTSSLEQVVVRQDTQDELHLDMTEDEENQELGETETSSVHQTTAPTSEKGTPGAAGESSCASEQRYQHRFHVSLLQQAASGSTECLIPPSAGGDQGAIAMANLGGDEIGFEGKGHQRKAAESPAVYRSEWMDVEEKEKRKRQREKYNKNYGGGNGWL